MGRKAFPATCNLCGAQCNLLIDPDHYLKWEGGLYAQDAFPYLSDGERELLISGTCSICFDEMFAEEDEG